MRGIVGAAAYIPYRRLDRSAIAEFTGGSGGRGRRAVASFDEDTTTMGFESARRATARAQVTPDALWFATAEPAYMEKTNATAIHAALRLPSEVPAHDAGGGLRSAMASLRSACDARSTIAVVSAGLRTGRPNGADESSGGDAAATIIVGDSGDAPVLAEFITAASETEEFIDRWRSPSSALNQQWEERFGETQYRPLADIAWKRALSEAGLDESDVARMVVAGGHARAVSRIGASLGVEIHGAELADTIGNSGAAQPLVGLVSAVEASRPNDVIAVVMIADGVEVLLFRATDAVTSLGSLPDNVEHQIADAGEVTYAKFLTWRGHLEVEPPNRPPPARVSASAAARSTDWKYGYVGTVDRSSGAVHMPPARVSFDGGAVDEMDPRPMADSVGRIVTFTVDKLAYSPSPPIVFAVVDFEGGGRTPVELCDVDADDVEIGDEVEMVFRRLGSTDGIHNYFWKARPVRRDRKAGA